MAYAGEVVGMVFDPIYFEKTYFLEPEEVGRKPFAPDRSLFPKSLLPSGPNVRTIPSIGAFT